MCLRAWNGPPSVRQGLSNKKLVRAMTYRTLAALAAVGAIALVFVTSETMARPGAVAAGPRAGIAPVRPLPHAQHDFRNRGRFGGGFYWPGYGDSSGAYAPTAEAPITAPLGGPNEIRYTYTQDVPWDWAHRFPPNVTPSDRPYVPSCTNEGVTVPGSDGEAHTVNVTRCY